MKKIRGLRYLPQNAVYSEMDSPVGKLTMIASAKGLHAILWDVDFINLEAKKIIESLNRTNNEKTIAKTKQQLTEYFLGQRKTFDLPLVIDGTNFQIQVWQQLLK